MKALDLRNRIERCDGSMPENGYVRWSLVAICELMDRLEQQMEDVQRRERQVTDLIDRLETNLHETNQLAKRAANSLRLLEQPSVEDV